MNDPNDRWLLKTERLARKIEPHRSAITTIELVHAAADGGPFTAVECKDASGRILASDDRGGVSVPNLTAVLREHFERVEVDDRGMAATFTVSGPRPPAPLPPKPFDERDRFLPLTMAELVERALARHHREVAVVTLNHVPSDGGPFTAVTLEDAAGRQLDYVDRAGFPASAAHRLLERYFEHVRVDDQGLHVHLAVSGPRAEPLPKR